MSSLAPAEPLSPRADTIREALLQLILKVSATLGALVYIPSVYVSIKRDARGLALVDTVAVVMVFGLLLGRRLPFRLRATGVCVTFYALGLALLICVGSISQIYLFGFSVVAVLLLGLRTGLAAAVLSSVSLLAGGLFGYAAPEMTVLGWTRSLTEWVVVTCNFTLVNILLTLAVGSLFESIDDALKRETAGRISLDRERNLLRTLLDTLPDVVFMKDTGGRFVTCNPATLALFGREREEEVTGRTIFDLASGEEAGRHHADDLEVMAGRTLLNREERTLDRAGQAHWYLTIKAPLRDAGGDPIGLIGISRDVTDRKRAEADRDRSLAQLQLQIERMPLAYLMSDRQLRLTRWNPAAERIFGYQEAEVLGKHPLDLIVPDELQPTHATLLDRIKAGSMDAHQESENRTKDGKLITCEWHNTPIFDHVGTFTGLLSLAEDVSARKKLEGQLRQSQKMEAVGLLAGGVAHDFNNLLSVVLSYAELMTTDMRSDDPLRVDVEEIRRAGERAASLTRQLLMFSRHQVMESKVLDLNELLLNVDRMLRRVVGEDIELVLGPDTSIGNVRADRGSVEQVIMNLVVNARDAMPIGGKLTIETANVTLDEEYARQHLEAKPGPYVMLSVTDTGCGMNKATLARIFEPFFTTKEKGRGTGLGLSTVFGIVRQSGGTIWVYSEPGLGTTFKVYLPRVDEIPDESRPSAPPSTLRGSETVLLVEDEDQVREVTRGILLRHGYTVLDARNAGEAFLLSEQHPGDIHLLLSDVVMPKMSGPALARRLAQSRPGMKVLCMSGYTDDAAVRHGVIDAQLEYLQKPITVVTLTTKVRKVLDCL